MAEKFVPYEKLSPKERRKLDAKSRRTWEGIKPRTRVVPNGKAYTRKVKHREKLW